MTRPFESFQIGEKAEFKHVITQDDIDRFVAITGDDNPVHVDEQYAAQTSLKSPIAHGMLSASFISTMVGKHLPGNGALWLSQNLNFQHPVRVGDELTIRAEVLKKQSRQKVLTLKTEVFNQFKQVVISGEGQVKVLALVAAKKVRREQKQGAVLVTGASRGIGAATARLLASKGLEVLVNYRSDEKGAQQTVAEIEKQGGVAAAFGADVTHAAEVEDMAKFAVRRFGAIRGLVNNATSRIVPQDFASMEWEDLELHLRVQVEGAFNCIQSLLDQLVENRGSVVNVSTVYTDSTPPAKMTGYITAKAALEAMTRSLAVEYGPQGVRFNIVSPGMTDTGLIADVPERTRLVTEAQTPMRSLASVDEVAAGIVFLLSEEAGHISGETLRICGGTVML